MQQQASKREVFGFLALILVGLFVPFNLSAATNAVQECRNMTLGRLGFGVPYRGTVENSDYGLRIIVPDGLTGWGAAMVAPFHGFTIFLGEGPSPTSCIVFNIQRRVDLGETQDRKQPASGRSIRVGNITGLKEENRGITDSTVFRNTFVTFSFSHNGETEDGSVWFIAPASEWTKYEKVFKTFLSQIKFN